MNDGLNSWCKQCVVEVTNAWRGEHENHQAAEREIKAGEFTNPNEFARRTCLHLAQYAERAISRFEHKTSLEAHPALLAVREVAASAAAEIEQEPYYMRNPHHRRYRSPRTRYEMRCIGCGDMFIAQRKDAKYCSRNCRDRNRYLRNRAREATAA